MEEVADVEADRHPAEHADGDILLLRRTEQAEGLLDDVRVDEAVLAHPDPRRQSSTGSRRRRSRGGRPSSWSIRSSAAERPMSYPGIRTVVRGGSISSEKSKSSKPVTATSSGT